MKVSPISPIMASLNCFIHLDQLVYAGKVKKTNDFGLQQERILAITSQGIYTIKKMKTKRMIPLVYIGGMTKKVFPKTNTKQFIVHVPSEYDYRLESEMRDDVMNIIKLVHHATQGTNIPIYHCEKNELKEFTTSKYDKMSGKSRFPPESMRSYEEDLFDDHGNKRTPTCKIIVTGDD